MKKTGFILASAAFAAAGIVSLGAPAHARTDVNINVGVPVGVVAPAPVVVAPQPVYIAQPPEMVFVPGLGVHFAPGVSVDLFFHGDYWWSRRGDRWYRADGYNGPWVTIGARHVPRAVYRVPPDYRTVYVREKRVPYGQWKKTHWKHGGKRHEGKRREKYDHGRGGRSDRGHGGVRGNPRD